MGPVDASGNAVRPDDGRHLRQLHREPGDAPPARWVHPVDQRRHAAPVDDAGQRDHAVPEGRERLQRAGHVVRRQRQPGPRRHRGRLEQPGRRLADVLLHEPAERPADVLPRPCVRDHPAQRVRRRGRGYVLQDPVLDSNWTCTILGSCVANATSLVSQRIIPATQIPLVIQDKTFVPDTAQLAAEDPTWDTRRVRRRSATSGSRTSTCPTRTRPTPVAPTPWVAGTTGPGSGPPTPASRTARSPNPLCQPQRCPCGELPEPGHPEPVARARIVHGHAGRQRHGLPGPERRPEGLPLLDPQRRQRPEPQPVAVAVRGQLRDERHQRRRELRDVDRHDPQQPGLRRGPDGARRRREPRHGRLHEARPDSTAAPAACRTRGQPARA